MHPWRKGTQHPHGNEVCVYMHQFVAQPATQAVPSSITALHERFAGVPDPKDKARLLLEAAKGLKPFPESSKVATNRVMGCTAQVSGGLPLMLPCSTSAYRV